MRNELSLKYKITLFSELKERIEEEAKKIEGTNFVVTGMFKPFALRDGNLITGQQQYSGAAAAKLVIEALGV